MLFGGSLLNLLKKFMPQGKVSQNKYVRYTTSVFAIVVIIAGLQQIQLRLYRKSRGLPNGPIGLPWLGNSMEFMKDLKPFLEKMPKYGPCSHVILLGENHMIINDHKLAKTIYADERLLTRQPLREKFPNLYRTSALSNGKEWAEGRKVGFSSMAKLLNKSFIEELLKRILKEHTFVNLDKIANSHELWFPLLSCRHIAFSVIFGAISDKTFGMKDKLFEDLDNGVSKWLNAVVFALSVPSMIQSSLARTAEEYQNISVALLEPFIQEQINSYDPANMQTWTHYILHELSRMNNEANKDKDENNNLDRLNVTENDMKLIYGEILSMLSAGIETTAYAMEYGSVILAKFPKYQQLLYDELIQKFENKQFQMSKMNECPILRAFVGETLRDATPSGAGGPRAAMFDYSLELTKSNVTDEYANFVGKKLVIPKDSVILFNYPHYSNSEIKNFNLDNYLKYDEVKKTYKYEPIPNVFMFSSGKRNCPGENVAMTELHIFFAQLVLNYKIKSPIKEEEIILRTRAQPIMHLYPKIGIIVERRE